MFQGEPELHFMLNVLKKANACSGFSSGHINLSPFTKEANASFIPLLVSVDSRT